jgi:PEP-CTERM motif
MNLLRWRNTICITVLALGLATVAPWASANIIPPGTPATFPDILPGAGTAGTLLATTGPTPFVSIPPPTALTGFTGTVTENVYANLTNTFCAGCLDFVYAFTNTSTLTQSVIDRTTLSSFGTFLTDVGYDPLNSLVGGTTAPVTVDRITAATIGFNMIVFPGTGTLDLVVETNAVNFTTGSITFQDGGVAAVAGFAPTGTPEPASLALMGTGIVFCARLLRRKKKNAEAAITA